MKAERYSRIWRRVGWGALIGLGVLIVIVAIALWLGPPRDPKCFALDDEDFGLGFKVGDPWDPDAFEAAMKENGLDVEKTRDINDTKVDDSSIEEYPFFSVAWTTSDGCLHIHAISDDRTEDASVSSITITPDLPSREWGREETREVYREARHEFGDDQQQLLEYTAELEALETAKRYPQVSTGEGICFSSSVEQVSGTYGKPLFKLSVIPGNPALFYLTDRQSVTFFCTRESICMVSIDEGYRTGGLKGSADLWIAYLTMPFILKCFEAIGKRIDAEEAKGEGEVVEVTG